MLPQLRPLARGSLLAVLRRVAAIHSSVTPEMPPPVRTATGLGRAVCRTVRTASSLPLRHNNSTQSAFKCTPQVLAIHHLLRQQPCRSASTIAPPQPLPPHSLNGSASNSQKPNDSSSAARPSQPSVWVSFLTLLSLFPILFAADDAIVTVATVHGRSMQPTLNPHLPPAASSSSSSSSSQSSPPSSPASPSSLDKVLVWKLSSQSSTSLPAGSLVVLKSPYHPTRSVIKRLVGREGDWITVPPARRRRRAAAAAAADSDESDREQRLMGGYGHIEQVGKGRVWVEGENDEASGEDSREYGQMPAALLQGRAVAVVWPPSRMRWIENSLQHVGGEQRLRSRMMAW